MRFQSRSWLWLYHLNAWLGWRIHLQDGSVMWPLRKSQFCTDCWQEASISPSIELSTLCLSVLTSWQQSSLKSSDSRDETIQKPWCLRGHIFSFPQYLIDYTDGSCSVQEITIQRHWNQEVEICVGHLGCWLPEWGNKQVVVINSTKCWGNLLHSNR